jgi:hypothetical protein
MKRHFRNLRLLAGSLVLYAALSGIASSQVTILSPADGSSYLPGTNLPVQVQATAPDGLVSSVTFILNGIPVSTVTSAPFRTEIQLPSIGSYELVARAIDNLGTESFSDPINLEAGPPDEVSPRVVIDFPLPLGDGDTVNDVSYASSMFLNATVKDPDGGTIETVEFYINGQLLGEAENNIGEVYSLYYDPNALGNYIISTKAIDNDGNVGWSVPLVLDVGPLERPLPKAEMVQPFPESILGRAVGLFVDVDSGLISVERVDFFANGVFLGSVDEPAVDNLYSFDWVPEEPGDYDLQARVVQIDPAGATWDNWTIADPVSITITEPPTGAQPEIAITNPVDGNFSIVLRQIIVQASGLDPLGSINEVRFYVNGKQVQSDDVFPYGFSYTPTSPGLYQFVAEMVSDRGILVQSDPVSVTVGVTDLPSGVFETPSESVNPTAGSTVPITIDASDPDGYVESIEYFVNGNSIGVDNSSPFTVFWTPSSRGIYDIDALITDNSGNEVLLSRTVSVVPPTGTVPRVTLSVTGSGNVTPGSRVVVLANVFDDTPDDLEVTFFQNGSQIGETDTEAPYSVIVDPESGFGPFGNAYSLTALATDPDGNSRADTLDPLYVSDFSVDQPSINILNIEDGDNYTKGSRVPIRVEVGGGAARNLANLVFYVDGVEIGRLAGGEPSGRYTFDWLPTETGTVQITAASLLSQEFYDHDRDSGLEGSTPRIPVTPVNVAFPVNINVNEAIGNLPSISLDVFPGNENLAIGSKVLVYADAQDLGGAVTQVEFFNDVVSVGVDTQAPFTHVLTTTHPGDFALNALATDSDGNVVTSTVVNLGVEDRVITRTPEISLTVPDSGQEGNPLSLRASVEGFVNGPEAVVFFVNGQAVGQSDTPPYSYSWLANLEGTLTFFATAQQPLSDGTLITTVSEIVDSFLVDNLPPVIGSFSFTYPNADDPAKPNPQLGDNLNFTVSMSDTGPVKTAELLRDGDVVQTLQNPASPFQFTDFPPGVGQYQYSVVVTDRGALQAQSQPLSVTVDERPGGGGPVDPDPTLPEILSFKSNVVGSSSLVNLPITLTLTATDEEGIESVEFYQDGTLVATDFAEPYEVEFVPTASGNYNFQARVTNLDGNQVISDALTVNVRQPNPLSQNTDFVYQTFLDLLMRIPTLEERNDFTSRIESGDLSRDRFIRELIAPSEGDEEMEYDAVRGVLLANRFLLGSWPSREQLEADVGTVSDGGLTALITSLMPLFESIYVAEVGGSVSGVPSKISSDAEIDLYNRYLFGQKYGIVPTSDQLELARLYFLSNGRDMFTTMFIQDLDVIPTGDSYFTADLGFEFAGDAPPSDAYMREADAASLLINLLRVVPSEEEVTALSQKLFAAQVSEILADPRYAARFQTAFRNLEHHANGWKYSEWFGWFNTAYEPWIYHADQGWISFTTVGQTEENFWYYDSVMGWNWTHGDMYPVLYNNAEGCWMMSIQLADPVTGWRSFYNFDSGEAIWIRR